MSGADAEALPPTGPGEGGAVLGEEARAALVAARLPASIEMMPDGYNSICQRSAEDAAALALQVLRPHVAALVAQARADGAAEERERIAGALDETADIAALSVTNRRNAAIWRTAAQHVRAYNEGAQTP